MPLKAFPVLYFKCLEQCIPLLKIIIKLYFFLRRLLQEIVANSDMEHSG